MTLGKLFKSPTHLVLLPFLGLTFSSSCFAIGEYIKQQSAEMLTTSSYITAGVLVFMLLLFVVQSMRKNKYKTIAQQKVAAKQVLLDNMPSGMLHLDLDGKVIFANNKAARLMGRDINNLHGSNFFECFSNQDINILQEAFSAPDSSIQVRAKASNLYLKISFGCTITESHMLENKVPFRVLTLSDENKIQKDLLQNIDMLEHQHHILNNLQFARLCLDMDNNTYVCDAKFDSLLSLGGMSEHENASSDAQALKYFEDKVHNSDLTKWKNALNQARQSTCAQLDCRVQLTTQDSNKVYIGVSIKLVGTSPSQSAEQGEELLHNTVEVFISENCEYEDNKQKIEVLTQQQQTFLSAAPGATYALDGNGNILWSNASFNQLIRQIAPDNKSHNVLDMGVFPEDIKKLHQTPPGVSTRSYNTEFELNSPDGKLLWIKLSLAFYSSKNRLNGQNSVGMVGVLSDVTELTKTKKALEQEQAQRAKMLDLAPVAIATINANDEIISANKVMSERLKFSDKEFKKHSFYHLFSDPVEASRAAKHINSSGQLRDFHAKLKGKDSKLHPSELHVDLINKDNKEYLCWIADRSDEQFQQDKFESLLLHSSMPMALLGENGFSQVNQAACDFFCVEDEFDLFGVAPHSSRLNTNKQSAKQLADIIAEIKHSGKAKSVHWQHCVGEHALPCQATYVPMYKDQAFDSILCIWTDKRELQKADEARMQAINLHQAAEREIAEKQKLLANSQDQLATKMRTLADTQTKLQSVQENLSETQVEYTHLQQQHRNVSDNLDQLKQQYSHSRVMLADAQRTNAALHTQLEDSSEKVKGLVGQRAQIAQALKNSESKYKAAQNDLVISQENAQNLQQEQQSQQTKMQALLEQIHDMKQAVTNKDTQITQVSQQICELQSQLSSSSNVTETLREQLINQRKASEQAELQRRELEQTCQLAQAQLSTKVRHMNHLQSEMEKLEEMSKQEKGDMAAQQSALKLELQSKLDQLDATQRALSEAKEATEQEKREKAAQQAKLEKMQSELLDAEENVRAQQQEMEQKEKDERIAQKQVQHKLWEELKSKQLKLQETEQILSQSKQQTEAEKAEKEKQSQLFEQLKSELQDIERRNIVQQQKMAQSDEQMQRNKDLLKQEVDTKREQLEQTKQALDEIKRQADQERLTRIEQEQKLEQLSLELNDVETRANKQKEMLAGNDEQWRKHHGEIEEQKQALQKALAKAEQQNCHLKDQLENKLGALQAAQTQVDKTQMGEEELQNELENARNQAQELQLKIAQQEQKEEQLQHQLGEQQQVLEAKESSISELQSKQKALTDELASVQKEYANSKESLSEQHSSHSSLSSQMSELESALNQSKQQLADKEAALQAAQSQLESSQQKLTEQENALLSAHKQELQEATAQASQQVGQSSLARPQIDELQMPENPTVWFDLLSYLQSQPQIESLPIALSQLMDELECNINETQSAIESNDNKSILASAKKLVKIADKINSDALSYLMQSIENDCSNSMIDNVSIRWPATKQGLQKTLRVVYSHLQA